MSVFATVGELAGQEVNGAPTDANVSAANMLLKNTVSNPVRNIASPDQGLGLKV
jgi:hypothetical protein